MSENRFQINSCTIFKFKNDKIDNQIIREYIYHLKDVINMDLYLPKTPFLSMNTDFVELSKKISEKLNINKNLGLLELSQVASDKLNINITNKSLIDKLNIIANNLDINESDYEKLKNRPNIYFFGFGVKP